MTENPTTQTDEAEADEGRRMDAELKVMGAIMRLLDKVEEPAQTRIVSYINSRYTAK